MNTRTSVGLLAAGLLGLGIGTAAAAPASTPPGFVGFAPSSVAGCPYIVWRLATSPSGAVHGIAYYSDLSGTSYVSGTLGPDGKLALTATKTSFGNGPVGTVTGTRFADGHLVATLTGEGCANDHVDIRPSPNLNKVANGETGGGR